MKEQQKKKRTTKTKTKSKKKQAVSKKKSLTNAKEHKDNIMFLSSLYYNFC
jgi:hypothetical protein